MFYIFLNGYNSRTIQDIKFKFSAFLSFTEATKRVKFQSARSTGLKVDSRILHGTVKGARRQGRRRLLKCGTAMERQRRSPSAKGVPRVQKARVGGEHERGDFPLP